MWTLNSNNEETINKNTELILTDGRTQYELAPGTFINYDVQMRWTGKRWLFSQLINIHCQKYLWLSALEICYIVTLILYAKSAINFDITNKINKHLPTATWVVTTAVRGCCNSPILAISTTYTKLRLQQRLSVNTLVQLHLYKQQW